MITCLLVDDDPELRELVSAKLVAQGLAVRSAATAKTFRSAFAQGGIDVVLLDVSLPDGDGIELCREIRCSSGVPIIMLTALGDPVSRVLGLEMGADDYVSKPFEPRELAARIKAVVRRTSGELAPTAPPAQAPAVAAVPAPPRHVDLGGWQVDWRNRMVVTPQGVGLPLSNVETRLLAAFIDHPNQLLSRQELIALTRFGDHESNERAVDLGVSRLRAKLHDSPDHPQLIVTVRGRGYQLRCGVR